MADRKQRSTRTAQQATTRPGSLLDAVPLDIAGAVPANHGQSRVTIRVEGLLNGARLTRGQNNGDRTWSLNTDELADLKYVPPYGGFTSHTLWIRILALDDGFANTLGVFALDVDPDDLPPRLPDSDPAEEPVQEPASKSSGKAKAAAAAPAPDVAGLTAQIEAEVQKKQAAETARQLKEARAAWQKEAEQAIAETRAGWQKEAETKLAETQEAWKKKAARMAAEAKAETEGVMLERIKAESGANAADSAAQAQKRAELEKRLRGTEKEREEAAGALADLQTQLEKSERAFEAAEKKAGAAAAENKKLSAALADTQAQAKESEKALEKAEARVAAAEKATQATDAKLVDARAKLARADEAAKKAGKDAAASAAEEVVALKADLGAMEKAHQAEIKKIQKDTKNAIDAEYAQALDALRAQHEEDMARRVAEERDSLTNEFDGRMAGLRAELEKAAESRVGAVESGIENAIADACATAVAEARADWERENERNLAEASEAWKRDQDQQLAAARLEWESEQQQVLDAARSEWLTEQETALAAAAAEARAVQDAAIAERDGYWKEELDQRLADARSDTSSDIDQRLDAVRAEWERAQEAALIERDDAWRSHVEQKLKEARQQWQAEEEERLAAAREDWQRSFAQNAEQISAQPDVTTEAVAPPPVEDASDPAGYPALSLQDSLPPAEVTPGPSRNAGPKKSGLSGLMRSLHRNTIGRLPMKLMVRGAVAAGLLIAGYFAYPYASSLFATRIVPISADMAAKVRGIGASLFSFGDKEEPVSPLIGRRFFIRPSAANLRVTPTPNADVVDIVERATVVEVLSVNGNWMRVRTIGRSVREGWIHRSLLADKPYS